MGGASFFPPWTSSCSGDSHARQERSVKSRQRSSDPLWIVCIANYTTHELSSPCVGQQWPDPSGPSPPYLPGSLGLVFCLVSFIPSLEIGFKNLKIRLIYLFVFVLRNHKIPGRSHFSPATTWGPGCKHFYPTSQLTRSYLNIFVPIIQEKKVSFGSLFSSSFFFSIPVGCF